MNIEECARNANDYELIMLYEENDEDAKTLLYAKYNSVIYLIIRKYIKVIKVLGIDFDEAYDEGILGFCDAINHYEDSKSASLTTFISVCIERRITGLLKKYQTFKSRISSDTYSLEYLYEIDKRPLLDILGNSEYEPLSRITEKEKYKELINDTEKNLSTSEKEVFRLMLKELSNKQIATILNKSSKQIDNTIQRIKSKIKELE